MRGRRTVRRLTPESAHPSVHLALAGAVTVFAALIPFVALVRSCVLFEKWWALPAWAALFLGAGVATVTLTVYACLATRRMNFHPAGPAAAIVVVYCVYALVFVGPARGKTVDVGQAYSGLHPTLRLAAGTVALFDNELIVTDAWRAPAAYKKMGLPLERRSLHFIQADGYARALDVRTIGRGFLRNALTALWFKALGLHTKRHVGTADHLHVSLPIPL